MPIPLLAAIGEGAAWLGLTAVLKNVWKWAVDKAPGFFAHVLGALGLYYFVAEPITEYGLEWVMQQFSGLPGTVLETVYYLDVDNYLSAVFSAYAIRNTTMAAKQAVLAKKSTA